MWRLAGWQPRMRRRAGGGCRERGKGGVRGGSEGRLGLDGRSGWKSDFGINSWRVETFLDFFCYFTFSSLMCICSTASACCFSVTASFAKHTWKRRFSFSLLMLICFRCKIFYLSVCQCTCLWCYFNTSAQLLKAPFNFCIMSTIIKKTTTNFIAFHCPLPFTKWQQTDIYLYLYTLYVFYILYFGTFLYIYFLPFLFRFVSLL